MTRYDTQHHNCPPARPSRLLRLNFIPPASSTPITLAHATSTSSDSKCNRVHLSPYPTLDCQLAREHRLTPLNTCEHREQLSTSSPCRLPNRRPSPSRGHARLARLNFIQFCAPWATLPMVWPFARLHVPPCSAYSRRNHALCSRNGHQRAHRKRLLGCSARPEIRPRTRPARRLLGWMFDGMEMESFHWSPGQPCSNCNRSLAFSTKALSSAGWESSPQPFCWERRAVVWSSGARRPLWPDQGHDLEHSLLFAVHWPLLLRRASMATRAISLHFRLGMGGEWGLGVALVMESGQKISAHSWPE